MWRKKSSKLATKKINKKKERTYRKQKEKQLKPLNLDKNKLTKKYKKEEPTNSTQKLNKHC